MLKTLVEIIKNRNGTCFYLAPLVSMHMGFKIIFLFEIITLLRYNRHPIKFIHLWCIIQRPLVYLQSCAFVIIILKHFHYPPKNCCTYYTHSHFPYSHPSQPWLAPSCVLGSPSASWLFDIPSKQWKLWALITRELANFCHASKLLYSWFVNNFYLLA